MNIPIKVNRDFERVLDGLVKKYGEDFEILNGFHESQLNFSDFIDGFIDKNVADATIDSNANAHHKDIRSMMNEKGKSEDKLFCYNKIYFELKKKYGLRTANEWLETEYNGGFYLHNAHTSSMIPYCYAYDLSRLAREGLFFLENYNNEAPKHLTTFLDDLIEDPNYQVSAVKLLLNIHQSLCDWEPGIKLIDKYHSVLSEKYTVELKSQFLCERAQECIISQKVAAAYDFFIRALTINPKCVRAHICLSKLLQSQHRPLEAIPHLLEVARTDPSMIMEVIPILRICFELPREQDLYLEKLREIQENCSSSSSASLIAEMAGFMEMTNEETQNFILMHLKKNPSLRLFSELLRYQQNNAQDQQSRESLGLIQSLVNAQIVKNPVYQCKNCGFQSKILFWHCPNCSNWSTISPIRGFDGD